MHKGLLIGLIATLFVPAAMAQSEDESIVISPQSIVVNPLPSFDVEVSVDKDPSGDAVPVYEIGESIRISVKVSEDAYVYLFNIHSDGEITQILPNNVDNSGRENFLSAGQVKSFPPANARYSFDVAGPAGLDKVIAVASKEPLATNTLRDFRDDGTFLTSNQNEDSFAQTLSIVVSPIAQENWVTDTVLFNVGRAPAQPRYGTLTIISEPAGASAYVDGQFVGRTPTSYGTTAGQHTVTVGADGYNTFETGVNLTGGQNLEVRTTLGRRVTEGRLNLRSNVAGAAIYINDSRQGEMPSSGEVTINGLPAGTHVLRLEASGFRGMQQEFTIQGGETTNVQLDLQRSNGTVNFSANIAGVNVYIGNELQGTTPTGAITLPQGRYQATFRRNGYRERSIDFEVQADNNSNVSVTLERDRSMLVPAIGLELPNGVEVQSYQEDGFTTRLQLRSSNSPEDLYALLHNQILGLDYQRQYVTLRDPARSIEAEYLRSNGSTLRLELVNNNTANIYQLTVSQ